MGHNGIDGGAPVNWGRASKDYAKYRDIYPDEFYRRITDLGLCTAGQRVLDLGTGTGVLPRNLYRYGARFTGVDISEGQIAEANRLAREGGMDIRFLAAEAETIGFPAATFDVVTACQCFIYFDLDRLLPKLHAVLREDGRLCVLWAAWLPEEDEIAGASERLVLKTNPAWTGGGFRRHPPEAPLWAEPWFEVELATAYDLAIPFTRESWHGRIRACRGIGASSLPDEAIRRFDREHLELLGHYPERFEIRHYVTMLVLKKYHAAHTG